MSKPQTNHNITIPEGLIKELLTSSELRMVKQRWLILELLAEGDTIRSIAKTVGVGTDTVMRVAKLAAEKPILQTLFRKPKPASTPPKWVFGQAKVEEE